MQKTTFVVATALLALGLVHSEALAKKRTNLDAANELVRLITPRSMYDDMMRKMVDGMIPAMSMQTGQAISDEKKTKLLLAVNEAIPYDEMIQWNAQVYAELFTVDELDGLLRFYRTPIGKKLAKMQPELMGRVGQKMGQVMPTRLPAALKKHGLTP